jgi:hypothetical protein
MSLGRRSISVQVTFALVYRLSFPITGGFHLDLVAARLRGRRETTPTPTITAEETTERLRIEPADEIPETIRRAIDGKITRTDREALKRPKVILTTRVIRADVDFP